MAKTTVEVKKETMSPMKTFKSSADLENCYRFIHENNLRREALAILKHVIEKMPAPQKKKAGRAKKKIH